MALSEIQGQPRVVGQLRSALLGGRTHHAYLLSGLSGVGVVEVGEAFAGALLCPSNPEGCGTCSSCDRARRALHPDLLRAGLQEGDKEVKVEAIRELCAALQLKPAEAVRKVALITQAEQMSTGAQNALLKTLEEPPRNTVLILTSEGEEWLLPTIHSRCLRIRLGPLPGELIRQRLQAQGIDAVEAELAARQSRGSLSRAEAFLSKTGGGFRARRDRVVEQLRLLLKEHGKAKAALAALALAEGSADGREEAAETLEILASALRDVLLLRGGAEARWLLTPDLASELARLAQGQSEARLLCALDDLARAATALEGNGSPRLQVEAAALRVGGLS